MKHSLNSLLAPWHNLSPVTRAILCVVISTLGFAAMHAMIRNLSKELHPFQIAFFRNAFGAIIFLPVIYQNGLGFLRTDRIGLHMARAVLNIIAMFSFFTALSITPLARVTALSFTSPIFAAVLSIIFLGERFRLRRWAATIAGFVGMLVMLRPGAVPIDTGSLLVLMSASVWAFCLIIIKTIARTDSSLTITGYMVILLSLLSVGPAIWVWRHPDLVAWIWLVLIGVVGTLAQLLLTQALSEADTTVVMPFDFLKLVWAAALGFLLFAEVPDAYTLLGAVLVFGATFYIAYRERVVARQRLRAGAPSEGS